MKDEINLEITNTNNRISTNKTRLELINLQLKKNQLIYFNSLKKHKSILKETNNIEEEKITSEYILDSENYNIELIDNNYSFIRKNKYGKIRNGNNLWVDFTDNIISKPFSGIKTIDKIVHKAVFDIKLKWQTIGNNIFSTGPIVWDKNNNIIQDSYSIYDGIKKGKKLIPSKDFLNNNTKNGKSSIIINNEKYDGYWVNWEKFNLDFRGSPFKEINHYDPTFQKYTAYSNNTKDIITLLINTKSNTKYEIYKWSNVLNKIIVTNNKYKLFLKPNENFSIKFDGRIEINIEINNVKIEPDDQHISKWYEINIPKDHYFSFHTHDNLGYKFKIHLNEKLYNANIFLNNYTHLSNEQKLKLEHIIKESNTSKNNYDRKKNELNEKKIENNILIEKMEVLKINDKINSEYVYINNKIKYLMNETNIEKAEEYINYLFTSQKIYNDLYNKYKPKNFNRINILQEDQTDIETLREEIQDTYYKSENILLDVKEISNDVKKSLLPNWRNVITKNFEIILNNKELIKSDCEVVVELKNNVYNETEWRDNISDTFKYYKKCVQCFDIIKDSYDNIDFFKNYLSTNKVFDSDIFNKINDSYILYQESKNRINNLYEDFKLFQKTADEIRDEEIQKINVHYKNIENCIKDVSNNVGILIEQHNKTATDNMKNITNISNTLNVIKKEEKEIETISDNKVITEDLINTSLEKKNIIQKHILETNNKVQSNISNNKAYTDLLTKIKKLYNDKKIDIDNENNKIIAINNINTNLEISTFYNNKKPSIDKLLNQNTKLLQVITNIETQYTIQLIKKNETETETMFKHYLNMGKSSNAYHTISKSKLLIQQIKINNTKCEDFSIDIINYINNSGINFFEKIQQVDNNTISLIIDCNKSRILLEEAKSLIITSQNETTCIINDLGKIRYILQKISLQNTNVDSCEKELKLVEKLSKQINSLKNGLDEQKKELENIGKTNIIKNNISFQVDEIVVKGTNQTMFRERNPRMINNKIIPSRTRNINTIFFHNRNLKTNILYNPPVAGYDNYIIRYIYWGEATLVPNKDHAPTNITTSNNDEDIGLLSIRYSMKNNTPFLDFYNTFNIPPYNEIKSINKGYFFKGDQQNGVWNYQDKIIDPSYGITNSMDWIKIQKFNSVKLYKDTVNNMGYFTVYENNDNKTDRPGNDIHKTTRFVDDEYGKRLDKLGNQGPRQIALKNHAALLGWLGSAEKKRLEDYIDNKIKSSNSQFIKDPIDYDYATGEGMFVMLNINTNFNNSLWIEKSPSTSPGIKTETIVSTNGKNFIPEHNGLIFFTVQNIKKGKKFERKLTAYKNMLSDLSFTTTLSSNKLYEFIYKDYNSLPSDPDPEKRPSGEYIYNDYEYFKQSGPNNSGKYTMIERNRTTGVEVTRILSPYIYEKNNSHKIPYFNDDSLSNIYRYTEQTVLINKIYKKDVVRIDFIDDPGKQIKFTTDTNIIEIRNINIHTLDIDESDAGLIGRYIYIPFIGFNSTNIEEGKYNKILDWNTLGHINTEYISINQSIFPIKQNGIQIIIKNTKATTTTTTLNSIKVEKLLITQKQAETQYNDGNYLIQNLNFDKNITGNNDKIMKMVIENPYIKFYKIINSDYDLGNISLTYTYINKANYWKYYKTTDPNYNLFKNNNNKPYNIKVNKIRIESNENFPLEICNLDVFTSAQFNNNDDPIKPLIKYSSPDSVDLYKFKNPQQSSTSDNEYNALKAVNGITEFDNYSQTEIDFTNKLKWFEVELDPPSRITSISFQARKNQKYNERINNAKIFLIDENNKKINWKWRQITPIPNGENYENDFDISNNQGEWIIGESAVLKSATDLNYNERVSKFSRIKTIQEHEYYPQEYFVKNEENLVQRNGYENQLYIYNNVALLDWDPIYTLKQNEKLERLENYNKGIIPQGFYIMTNSNWNYDWVVNKTFGMEFKKNNNIDILEIYSLKNDYEKNAKKFTYYYDNIDQTYNLNGDVEANMFFWKHSKVTADTFKMYENRLEILESRNTNVEQFISVNRLIESINKYKKKIDDMKKNKIELRKKKRIKNGEYLIESTKYSKHINLSVNHPIIKLFYLNSNYDISIDTYIKKIIVEGKFNTIKKSDITIIDHKNIILKQEFYSVIQENDGIHINLEKIMNIYQIKCNKILLPIFNKSKIKLINKYNQIVPYNNTDTKTPEQHIIWGVKDSINIYPITFTKKIKSIKFELIRSDFVFDGIVLYDIDGYKLPNDKYQSEKKDNIITLILNYEQELTKIKTTRNANIDISGSKIYLYSKLNQQLSLSKLKYFKMNSDIIQTINISINIPIYKDSLEEFTWNEKDDNNPDINDLRYISNKNDSDSLNTTLIISKINYIENKNNKLITLKDYKLERKRVFDLQNLKNKEFRSKLPGDDGAEFYVFEEDKIPDIYNTHSKNSFKIIKDIDKLYIIKLNDNLEELNLPNKIYKTYIWNKNNHKYEYTEDKSDYITELHDPIDYKKETWVIINQIKIDTITKIIRMKIQYFPLTLKLYREEEERKNVLDLKKKLETEINPNNYLIKNHIPTTSSEITYLEAVNKKIIRFYNATISKLQNNNYKTLNKLDPLSLPFTEFHILKQTDGTYKYISFSNGLYNKKVFLYKKVDNHNILILNNNSVITELTMGDWIKEKEIIDEKYELEYNMSIKIQEESRLKKLEKEISNLDTKLLHSIGGDLLKNNIATGKYWDYLFNNMSELEEFNKLIPSEISDLTYENLIKIHKIGNQINSKKKDGAFFYVSRGVELWDRNNQFGKFRFIPEKEELNNIYENIDNINFQMSEILSLHFQNYKDKLDKLGKKDDKKDLKLYTLLRNVLNKVTRIRYFIEYKSNEQLINLFINQDNKLIINEDIRPNNAHKNDSIKMLINNNDNILKNYKMKINKNTELNQILFSHDHLNPIYKKHQNNDGTIELLNDVKTYMDKINKISLLINFFKLFNIYGPINNNGNVYWNYNSFNKDYNALPRSINKFINISSLGPYPNEFIMGVSEKDIFNYTFVPNKSYKCRFDNPYDQANINKVNEISKKNEINKEYQKKLKEFYEIVYNIRKWQITISNRNLLKELSPNNKKWNSLDDLKNDIIKLRNIKDITVYTSFNIANIDITLKNNSFKKHIDTHGSIIIRDHINEYYSNINRIIKTILEVKKSTPIIEGRYLAIDDKDNKKELIITKDNKIKMLSVDKNLNKISEKEEILIHNDKKNEYNNENIFINIISYEKDIYEININNKKNTLLSWPTFYSFGEDILEIPKKLIDRNNFINGMESKNYSTFEWWINQQNRNMDASIGSRLNSEKSVAKEALKMPYLIYLRNNILLPLRGYNERIINGKKIYISWHNKGIFSFTKNELIIKQQELNWWLNEWTKPMHYDINENIVVENKAIDTENGKKIPKSQRWTNQYNTVKIFDSFISNDTIIQWASFLKNTGWNNEIKKNVTHKIIETAIFPIIERVTRHTKELIDICIHLHELNEKRNKYIDIANDYINLNDKKYNLKQKTALKQKYINTDIKTELEDTKKIFLDKLNDINFVKLYKSMKKRVFDEDDTIKIEKSGKIINENIVDHMSKVVHGYQVFSEWKHYQEYGWRSYGHGACGEWFDGAYDHPDTEKRDKIKFNIKLKEFFVNTTRTLVTLKSLTNTDYTLTNHIRLINESYSANYWFNDYKKITELVIKDQFLNINNITEQENRIKKINDELIFGETSEKNMINEHIEKQYNLLYNMSNEYKKFYLHDFFYNNSKDFYSENKIIVNFLSIPNRLVILLKNDFDKIYDLTHVSIYDKKTTNKQIINNEILPINNSKKIVDLKEIMTYHDTIIKNITEYKIPFSYFDLFKTNSLDGAMKEFKLAVVLKKNNDNKRKIYAIANVKPFVLSDNKNNIKNSYLSWLNYKEKLQLLIPEANNMINFIKNKKENSYIKNKDFLDDKTIEFQTIKNVKIPSEIKIAQSNYSIIYEKYKQIFINDKYTPGSWKNLLDILYGKNSITQEFNAKIKETFGIFDKWTINIDKFNENFKTYNSLYNEIKPLLGEGKKITSGFIYLNKLMSNITLSNINDYLIKINKEHSLFIKFLEIINNINNLHDNTYNFKLTKNKNISIIDTNIEIIRKYDIVLKNGIKNPYSIERHHHTDNDMYFYKNKWEDERKMIKENNYINKFTGLIETTNNQFAGVTNLYNIINEDYNLAVELRQKAKYQETDLQIFKQMMIDMDLLVMNYKNVESPIINNFDSVKKEFSLLNKLYEKISEKTDSFLQNDINSLNEAIILFNPTFHKIRNNILDYDNFIKQYNKDVQKNVLFKDINIDTLKIDITNTNIKNIHQRIDYNKYINRTILYNTIFKINNFTNVILNIKKEIQKIETKIPLFLNEGANIKKKSEYYLDTLMQKLNTNFTTNKILKKKINDKRQLSVEYYKYIINDILFKIPTGNYDLVTYNDDKKIKKLDVISNGDNLKLQNKNILINFKFDDKKQIYYDINKNKLSNTFYKLEIVLHNWKYYKLNLQKVENITIKNLLVEVIKNNETFYIELVENTTKTISAIKSSITEINKFNTFIVNNNKKIISDFQKFKKIKKEIDSYNWIMSSKNTSDILKKNNDYNSLINSIEANNQELDLQLYQLSLFKLKFEMNIIKKQFFTGYKIIETNAIALRNPYDNTNFNILDESIIKYKDLHDKIINSFTSNKNLIFYLNNIKSFVDVNDYKNIYNYYIVIENRIYANNDNEMNMCKKIFSDVINDKNNIIKNKKETIDNLIEKLKDDVIILKQLSNSNKIKSDEIKQNIIDNDTKIKNSLQEITIQNLKDISSNINNIENRIRNSLNNIEKQKLLIELEEEEEELLEKSQKADNNYDKIIVINRNSNLILNSYIGLIDDLLNKRDNLQRQLSIGFNLLDITTDLQEISNIIMTISNTKTNMNKLIDITFQKITKYDNELSKY
jgi:hypothetical protein